MIRLRDGLTIASTKLKTHRVRTSLSVGISGVLFGLLVLVIVVAQGAFNSIDRFSDEGLNNRTLLTVSITQDFVKSPYYMREDERFISMVEDAYTQRISTKKAVAKKYGFEFNQLTDDPSPVAYDKILKRKVINSNALDSPDVVTVFEANFASPQEKPSIEDVLKPYKSSKIIQEVRSVAPFSGDLKLMVDGKENLRNIQESLNPVTQNGDNGEGGSINVVEESLAEPFVTVDFDATKGEIPVILPVQNAEKQLGLKPLDRGVSVEDKYNRLQEVRSRIGEVAVPYCYRNEASRELVQQAMSQADMIRTGANDPDFIKPKVIYQLPAEDSCGPVTITSDTRSAQDKKAEQNLVAFQKELGEFKGEPAQQKIVFRGVGVSGDTNTTPTSFVADIISGLLTSSLGYGTWSIPENMLNQVPSEFKAGELFDDSKNTYYRPSDDYIVGFSDKDEARSLSNNSLGSRTLFIWQFGSNTLVVDEMKAGFVKVLNWLIVVVGAIALVILMAMIGRTVAEGRRESAVFRAIGASRSDIGAIYGVYTILLSLRVVVFAMALGLTLALITQVLYGNDATLGARLAYAATDTDKQFTLFSLSSPYLLCVVAIILVAGMLSSIVPIVNGARRNPITDMRNDA